MVHSGGWRYLVFGCAWQEHCEIDGCRGVISDETGTSGRSIVLNDAIRAEVPARDRPGWPEAFFWLGTACFCG